MIEHFHSKLLSFSVWIFFQFNQKFQIDMILQFLVIREFWQTQQKACIKIKHTDYNGYEITTWRGISRHFSISPAIFFSLRSFPLLKCQKCGQSRNSMITPCIFFKTRIISATKWGWSGLFENIYIFNNGMLKKSLPRISTQKFLFSEHWKMEMVSYDTT